MRIFGTRTKVQAHQLPFALKLILLKLAKLLNTPAPVTPTTSPVGSTSTLPTTSELFTKKINRSDGR